MDEVVAEAQMDAPDVILAGIIVEGDLDEDAKMALRLLMDRHGWSYRAVNDLLRLYRLHPNLSKFKTVHDILDTKVLPPVTSCKVCPSCHEVADGPTCNNDW